MDIDSSLERRIHAAGFEILDTNADSLRDEIETWCGGSLRRIFLEGVLPHVPRKALVVELGPSGGSWTRAFLQGVPDCTVALVDAESSSDDELRRWKGRVETIPTTSNGAIDLATGSVDFLFSFGFLCRLHVSAIEPLLVELRRVARPGAAALLHHADTAKRASFRREAKTRDAGDQGEFPTNDAGTMAACAVRAGWEVASMDLGFFRRDGFILLRAPSAAGAVPSATAAPDPLRELREAVLAGRFRDAFELGVRLKIALKQHPGLDRLRAKAFLGLGRDVEAFEACKEELRWNPGDAEAASMFESLRSCVAPVALPEDDEFRTLFERIRPYTMLSVERLWSLFSHAREICRDDLPGNFVECGVAAGGSSALLSWVVKHHSRRPRTVYSLDTFEGMPAPTDEDRHEGVAADDTGWGTATCSAPLESLMGICARLGTDGIVRPLVGLFQETLPVHRAEMGEIAFLHMDGDWYDSTKAILLNVYDQVAPGGFVQVDDYGHWDGCRQAIHEFESDRKLSFRTTVIDATGVWFRKGRDEDRVLPAPIPVCGARSGDTVVEGLRLLRDDRADEALELARRLAAAGAREEGLAMLEAVALLRLGRTGEGVASLRREVAEFPGNEAARGALADLGFPIGDPPRPRVPVPGLADGGVYLNLGCGAVFDPRWVNCDVAPAAPGVRGMDASRPLEFPTESVHVVYSSHMLEHLPVDGARAFLAECRRVLRPGGVVRMVVPDLEGIARAYLRELDGVDSRVPGAEVRRDWMVLELLDQVARHRSGGEMLRWWAREPVPEKAFVLERVGTEASRAMDDLRRDPTPALKDDSADPTEVGRFRLSGEVHRWMYDRVSLAALLREAGFDDPHVVTASRSAIPGFAGSGLDADAAGKSRKPDSLYMEAHRS